MFETQKVEVSSPEVGANVGDLFSSGCKVPTPVAEAFFGGMTKVMLAESVQDSKNGSEFTGGGRQCWGLVLKCYELRTRQHKMLNIKSPSSFKSLFPFGYNEFRTKVMKDVAEAFFGGMTKVMLAESVQDSKNGSEFTGGGRQCWGLVLKCYELRTRQHKMLNIKSPSSFKSLFPFGYNEFRTKVMKDVPS